jgi:hypothetical protein
MSPVSTRIPGYFYLQEVSMSRKMEITAYGNCVRELENFTMAEAELCFCDVLSCQLELDRHYTVRKNIVFPDKGEYMANMTVKIRE